MNPPGFEFDPEKSRSNQLKHGIDFEQIQLLWSDPLRLELIPANSFWEDRWLAIGEVQGVIWTAAYSLRGNLIRLISARRAREEEKDAYYER